MTASPEKAAPIPADVLALAEDHAERLDCNPVRARNVIARAIMQDRADREARPSLPDNREERIREDGWRPMAAAPRDGTRILAVLHREGCHDMDDGWMPPFSEVREIWFKPHRELGMEFFWHAGDPYDSHDGMAPDHFGEAVPVKWMPLPDRARVRQGGSHG